MDHLVPIASAPGYFAELETGEIWSARRGAPVRLAGGWSKGYRIYSLMIDGVQKMRFGHRLVCEASSGPCPASHECGHRDGDRGNNKAANLRWVPASENNGADKRAHGRLHFGSKHQNSRLTEEAVDASRKRFARGERSCDLAKEHGVSRSAMSKAINGTLWRHV